MHFGTFRDFRKTHFLGQQACSADLFSDGPIVPAVFHHGQSLGKASPDGFQMLRVKVQSGQRSLIASAEAALHRVTPRNTQLPPHGDPGCGFLVPLDLEGAQRQREGRRGPLHEMR